MPMVYQCIPEMVQVEVNTQQRGTSMHIDEVKKRAQEIGIEPGNMSQGELIRVIQEAEGNPPSFGNNDGNCPHRACCWWDDCVKAYVKAE
jgi:hypothetical protein